MAEIDKGKQRYLAQRFPHTIMFQDVSDLHKTHARTWDGGAAKVPKARFWGLNHWDATTHQNKLDSTYSSINDDHTGID